MTVKDLINKLSTFNRDLPVYLGDWNEEYADDLLLDGSMISQLPPYNQERRGYELKLPSRLVIGSSSSKSF